MVRCLEKSAIAASLPSGQRDNWEKMIVIAKKIDFAKFSNDFCRGVHVFLQVVVSKTDVKFSVFQQLIFNCLQGVSFKILKYLCNIFFLNLKIFYMLQIMHSYFWCLPNFSTGKFSGFQNYDTNFITFDNVLYIFYNLKPFAKKPQIMTVFQWRNLNFWKIQIRFKKLKNIVFESSCRSCLKMFQAETE